MAKLPTRKRVFDLAGEGQRNADGSDRQEELLQCEPGEPVELRREPNNPYDSNAILVVSSRGVGIGYLKRDDAAEIASVIGGGRQHEAKLHCLRGGVPGYDRYGAQISIAWDNRPAHPHVPLDEAQLRSRHSRHAIAGRARDEVGRLLPAKAGTGCIGMLVLPLMFGMAAVIWG